MKEYVRSFPERKKTNLQEEIRGDKEGIDLLERLIVFDPRRRIAMREIF